MIKSSNIVLSVISWNNFKNWNKKSFVFSDAFFISGGKVQTTKKPGSKQFITTRPGTVNTPATLKQSNPLMFDTKLYV